MQYTIEFVIDEVAMEIIIVAIELLTLDEEVEVVIDMHEIKQNDEHDDLDSLLFVIRQIAVIELRQQPEEQ